jgi:long-chain acyl-CoA synthetase
MSARTPCATLPVHPVAQALEGLRGTLGSDIAFCLSDTVQPDLTTCDPTQFATFTGGTSGRPKVILRSQASWIKSFETHAARFAYTPTDRIAVLGALSHSLALYGVIEAVHLGLSVHVLSTLTAARQHAALSQSGCTILYATPTQLRLLPAHSPLTDLRLILCGGGALSPTVRAHITAIAPNAQLVEFYGAAETSFLTLSDATTPDGSVGRAYPDVEISVRDADSTGTGLIWVRSPYLFARYLNGGSPHTRREGDWLTVGEYGMLDANGYLFLRGRAGRMINIADTAVFPEELEAQIMALPEVSNCAVVAQPDALRGHHLVAMIDGAEAPALRNHILTHCKTSGLITPHRIAFLDPFPLLPSGKPDLQQIAALTKDTP